MTPLHICFISQEYPPDTGWGGIGSYTYEMAHGLVQAGHRATVIARAASDEKIVDDAGVEVHRIAPKPEWDKLRGLWRMNHFWPGFAWSAMLTLRRIHTRSRVDLVEAGECRADGFFVPWLIRRPRLVVRLHTAWVFVDRYNDIRADRKKRFVYWQEAQAIRQADAVTAPSQAVLDLTATWIPLSGRRTAMIPNPVDTRRFAAGTDARRNEILFSGRLERRKGVGVIADGLAEIFARCPETAFRFVGSDGTDTRVGSWRDYLRNAVPEPERSRLIFEHLSRDRLIECYRHAAAGVVPSLWENCPYVLLEMMACGTPVVATRTGGLPELVEDGISGLLVPPGDGAALAHALGEVISDPARSRAMAARARQRVAACFDTRVIVPPMVELYSSVLGDSH